MISIDLFAGAGGVSLGIEQALGVAPVVAINHDPVALNTHARNHKGTMHLCKSVFDVPPFFPVRGRGVDLLWASPDCAHFSIAKSGKPREKGIRDLAWVVVDWAREVAPRVICLENVKEFLSWGPLDEHGKPIPERKGETFRQWCQALRDCGYTLEWRVLRAADYGVPTSRERLFLVARCDGVPICWPEPTHGPRRLSPYRTAAECIDFSLPCPSISLTRAEAKALGYGRINRPLADATLRRIAEGVRRFVLEAAEPYIVELPSGQRVAPFRVHTANGERKAGRHGRTDQAPRAHSLEQPMHTICATGSQGALVAAYLAKHNGSGDDWSKAIGQPLTEPLHTVTARDTKSLIAAFLTKYYGEGTGQSLTSPLGTITTRDRFGLVTVRIDGEDYVITDIGMRMLSGRELARAHGFPDTYALPETREAQIACIGNSVPPDLPEAVVAAQFGRPGAEPAQLELWGAA
jgi:DNA (cytosine-5)-methyltransferase 1